jgi:hypothetical protein
MAREAGQRRWLTAAIAVLLAAPVAVDLYLLAFVFPRFVEVYQETGATTLPAPTRVLLQASDFVTAKWWVLALVVVVFWVGLALVGRSSWGRTLSGRMGVDWGRVGIALAVTLSVIAVLGVPVIMWAMMLPTAQVSTTLSSGP